MTIQWTPPGEEPSGWYSVASDLYSHEISAISDRTNVFFVFQTILVGGIVFAFQASLGYLFPYLLFAISVIGSLYCLLHSLSGGLVARSARQWRQYMRNLESNNQNTPWQWFYSEYERLQGNRVLLERTPLPMMWLTAPIIFAFVWVGASSYPLIRAYFDSTFAASCYRLAVFVAGWIAVLTTLAMLITLIIRLFLWQRDRQT
jgi:hypothetical protein